MMPIKLYDKMQYRIIREPDFDIEALKGDMFNPNVITDLDPGQLKREERSFERLVDRNGVFGFVLEYWDADIDCGWTPLDSCWGFIGETEEDGTPHYIIGEFINKIEELIKEKSNAK